VDCLRRAMCERVCVMFHRFDIDIPSSHSNRRPLYPPSDIVSPFFVQSRNVDSRFKSHSYPVLSQLVAHKVPNARMRFILNQRQGSRTFGRNRRAGRYARARVSGIVEPRKSPIPGRGCPSTTNRTQQEGTLQPECGGGGVALRDP
jgi:hypothetical protein